MTVYEPTTRFDLSRARVSARGISPSAFGGFTRGVCTSDEKVLLPVLADSNPVDV